MGFQKTTLGWFFKRYFKQHLKIIQKLLWSNEVPNGCSKNPVVLETNQ